MATLAKANLARKPDSFRHSRRSRASRIEPFPAFFVPADDELKAIFAGDHANWVDWLGSKRLKVAVTAFLQSIVDGLPKNIHCEIDEAAMCAGHNEICVSIRLALRERHLIAALAARKDKGAVRSHLIALGFL
jgi:hypothetical protein